MRGKITKTNNKPPKQRRIVKRAGNEVAENASITPPRILSRLESLPDELIDMVAGYLDCGTDLNSFIRVARKFWTIGEPHLYANRLYISDSIQNRDETAQANILVFFNTMLCRSKSFQGIKEFRVQLPSQDLGLVDEYTIDQVRLQAVALGLRSSSHFSEHWRRRVLQPLPPAHMNYFTRRRSFQHDLYALVIELILLKSSSLRHLKIEDSVALPKPLFGDTLPSQKPTILGMLPRLESLEIFANQMTILQTCNFEALIARPNLRELILDGRSEDASVKMLDSTKMFPNIRKLKMLVNSLSRIHVFDICVAFSNLEDFEVRINRGEYVNGTNQVTEYLADTQHVLTDLMLSPLAYKLRRIVIINNARPERVNQVLDYAIRVCVNRMPNVELINIDGDVWTRPT